jgi:hypothetical protein
MSGRFAVNIPSNGRLPNGRSNLHGRHDATTDWPHSSLDRREPELGRDERHIQYRGNNSRQGFDQATPVNAALGWKIWRHGFCNLLNLTE